jgi:2-keto-4-pentenoate hydratase
MTHDDKQRMAELLATAENTQTPIDPLTADFPGMSAEDAYAVQLLNVERRVAAGERLRGHKIGLTARAMQKKFNVDVPDYGHLFEEMFLYEQAVVLIDELISPMVEVEPAFILGRPLRGPGVNIADVIRATDCLVASIEIIDSRIKNWNIRLADTVADNGSSARVVLAGNPVRLTDLDPRQLGAALYVNGQLVESGSSSAILGNPITAVAWLANAVGAHGVTLEEGHVVLPGTCIPAVSIKAGDVVRGSFSILGDVELSFC